VVRGAHAACAAHRLSRSIGAADALAVHA